MNRALDQAKLTGIIQKAAAVAEPAVIGTPVIILKPYNESVWMKDYDLVDLRSYVDDTFRDIWATGFKNSVYSYYYV
jgi:hypothetical protein